ncbi:glycosyltransferase family 9 protein [uncultured Rikenella sp.]|uniref:glycosyltransferase family 9 protein n=1 Tax=uncultured Rikenella sp. TaxID=368003 RepID=UPI0025E0472D|nr:glycosyltransferase family 9 protein [uncultured Rikenella sp.]
MPKKILVIRSSAMGDVAMTAPVLAQVAEAYPEVEIVLLTRRFYEPFFDGIDRLTIHNINIDQGQAHRGVKGLVRLFRELRRSCPGVEMVIDLQDKIYSKLLRKFYRLAGVRTFHIDKGRVEKKHLTAAPGKGKVMRQLRTSIDRYADVFRQAGFELGTVPAELSFYRRERVVPAGLGFSKAAGGVWIGIAPFAQHQGKVYPLEKMQEVMRMAGERWRQARMFIFGGGEEERRLAERAVAEEPSGRAVSVVGRFSLREEMDLMANLDLMVSMDSSAMHMASLVGVPVVSVWGATHPYAGFLGLGQAAEDAVGLEMDCRPCSVYGHKVCWRGDYACMNDLAPEAVFERMVRRLG